MINLNKACEIAVNYFQKEENKTGICEILDAGSAWIFYGGNSDEIEIGAAGITISKNDGVIEPFILPSPKGFELLDKAVDLDIPSEFQAKQ